MSSLCTLGESWIKAIFDDAIAETICSSTVGRQSDLHTDGSSLGLQGSILLSTLPLSAHHFKLHIFIVYRSSSGHWCDQWPHTGLALASTLTHWGLRHGTPSSLDTNAGASSQLILQRSEWLFHFELHTKNMDPLWPLSCGRTWSLWKAPKEGNRWGNTFQTVHTSSVEN